LKDDQAAAELADLFAESPEKPAAGGQAETAQQAPSAPTAEKQPRKVIDESADVLDQIAATSPKPVLPSPQARANVRIFNWRVIDGAPVGNFFTGVEHHTFMRPVAVAVRSEYLYVVDAGANILYRLDMASRRLESLLDLKAEVKGEVDDIYVDKDFSFYLTDTAGARVIHYDRDGDVLQVFSDYYNLVWPTAVTALENGDVVVADGHFDQLLQFTSAGKLIAAYGGRGKGVGQFLNITTMTRGPDGYYVGARVGRRLQVLGRDGNYLYAFQEGAAVFPAAIAVDRNNRSYVADYMDNTIKVFDRGSLVGTIGRFGNGTGQFKRITDLWLDGNRLYIVDSLNARIQVAQLSPDPVAKPEPVSDLSTEPLPDAVEPTPPAPAAEQPQAVEPAPQQGTDTSAQPAAENTPPDNSK
jgi:hypothetical protein